METIRFRVLGTVVGCILLSWITDTIALKEVQLLAPSAVKLGDTVKLGCTWKLEGNETLYSVKWYRGRQEFFSYLPKEFPFTRIFAQPGIDVDLSQSTLTQVVLRHATRALAGRYRCEVSADAPSFHTQVRSAIIHVVDLPVGKPKITAEKSWYASGDSLKAQCTSPPADPPANLTWLFNGQEIKDKPIIQQQILPSPSVSIDFPQSARITVAPVEENSNIIFRPWKTNGPYVDNMQDGDLVLGPDTVILPTPRHQDDEDSTDSLPTTEISNKMASISQISFMVKPDSFVGGQLSLKCISTVHTVYSEDDELIINEERPQIASVLGTRDGAPVPTSGTEILHVLFDTAHDATCYIHANRLADSGCRRLCRRGPRATSGDASLQCGADYTSCYCRKVTREVLKLWCNMQCQCSANQVNRADYNS